MPEKPTWDFIIDAAKKLTDKSAGVYGICLRGKAGWGENMAFITAMANSFGARWFDEKWNPQFDSPEWKETIDTYLKVMKDAGPPGAVSNGFNENLALFNSGKCAMWIDATVAAGFVTDPKESKVADKAGFALAPEQGPRQERQLAVGLVARHSRRLQEGRRRREVHQLGHEQAICRAGGCQGGLGPRSAGHAQVALRQPEISEGGALRQADARIDQHGRSDASRPSSPFPMSGSSSWQFPSSRAWAPRSGSSSRPRLPARRPANRRWPAPKRRSRAT